MPRDEAARMLQAAEAVQARAAGVPRAHAVLMLMYAVMMSAYMALFVFAGSDAVDTATTGLFLDSLMVPTMIIGALLLNGAGQRYAGRLRPGLRLRLTWFVFGALLVGLLAWKMLAGSYPVWITPVCVVVTLIVFGARPLALLRHPAVVAAPVGSAPLPTAVRIATAVLGALFAAMCATAFQPAGSVGLLMLMIILVGAATVPTSRWGLPAIGWYWGIAQWIAFGISSALLLVLTLLIVTEAVTTRAVPIALGVVIAASLIVSAFLPGRGDPEDDFEYDPDFGEEPADGASEA
jgi:hypothetical protein